MIDKISRAAAAAQTLGEMKTALLSILGEVRHGGSDKLGYVAGIVSSDGRNHVKENVERLVIHTERIRKLHVFPIFSCSDFLSPETISRWEREGVVQEDYLVFFRDVLQSGHVTDVFMTPRWRQSAGALDEHATAKKIGLRIHYLDEDPVEEEY